ncbi:ATP-dependent Clp protease ATP-binding subunit CLPT2, chloroplastic [Ziziphus jujuba]|uniref:ATP-dependent Clp protease ATP-binding subunit CLPT2, chloroplastic n=1 Tax=Ziziphus jujuba TaxID=326968 RepID=A0A6P3YQC0_ZIZJJ|nr:ATP-dependent Clp protease ATP-binding subunit CLPT2, chloroplastic [Ziziphus jujuba]
MAARTFAKLPTAITVSQSNCSRTTHETSSLTPTRTLRPNIFRSPWLGTDCLWLQASSFRSQAPKIRLVTATVSLSLPTAKPERLSSPEKVPKWSRRAIKSFAMGELEARKLKYPTTGTEALLMGILIEGTSLAAKFLRANGVTLLKVREETIKLLGKGDMYFFSPEHPPLTEDAQRALDRAVDKKITSGDNGEITTTHILLGIWSEVESPGHKILSAFGFSDEKAKELESLSSEPGFVDD